MSETPTNTPAAETADPAVADQPSQVTEGAATETAPSPDETAAGSASEPTEPAADEKQSPTPLPFPPLGREALEREAPVRPR